MTTFTPGKDYPIETATEAMASGARILVWVPATKYNDGVWTSARWDKDEYAVRPKPYWSMDYFLGRISDSRNRQPTHWMPMPPAPEEAQ
jgi:hypothetical protein